nr:MAG TPA: hypothetical protein [Caudoviricetes sp.]
MPYCFSNIFHNFTSFLKYSITQKYRMEQRKN